ncbi:MAG: ribosome-associated translation inhibitor RaiA [Candidatus Latescibacteria bacterium]|jgi:ribosomal subunit interface protein|nr:ribosome-associated translation inhibitor RaiA [Candidatus Latescibacterota bacterium]
MDIAIAGHHYHVSDVTREHIESEVSRLERFYTPLIGCQVTIAQDGHGHSVDVIINVHGQTLKASDQGRKLFPVIDTAIKKMSRQLKKLHDRRRKPRSSAHTVDVASDIEE